MQTAEQHLSQGRERLGNTIDIENSLQSLPQLGNDPNKIYRLGIMGGTFDPIHNGHLVAAQQVAEDLALDVVLFMPSGTPAFKQDFGVSNKEDRFAMTLLATSDNPLFRTSRLEIDRCGLTYTIDTLRTLRQYYPSNVELYFITGADALIDIVKWHDAQHLADCAEFVGVSRPGYNLKSVKEALATSSVNLHVQYLEVPALAISSTDLRRRVSRNMSIRYLTPDAVIDYINKHSLYTDRTA